MKHKKTDESQSEFKRRVEVLSLLAASIVIVTTLILFYRVQTNTSDNTWWIRLLVTQIALLVGCLIGMQWMRAGAVISMCSALFGSFFLVRILELEGFDSTTTLLLAALVYASLILSIGLEQWELADSLKGSAAASEPHQNSTSVINSLPNPLSFHTSDTSSSSGISTGSGGVNLGSSINTSSSIDAGGGIDLSSGVDAGGGIDLGGIDLSGIDLSGIDLSGLIDLSNLT
jgi:hypothetical protein